MCKILTKNRNISAWVKRQIWQVFKILNLGTVHYLELWIYLFCPDQNIMNSSLTFYTTRNLNIIFTQFFLFLTNKSADFTKIQKRETYSSASISLHLCTYAIVNTETRNIDRAISLPLFNFFEICTFEFPKN